MCIRTGCHNFFQAFVPLRVYVLHPLAFIKDNVFKSNVTEPRLEPVKQVVVYNHESFIERPCSVLLLSVNNAKIKDIEAPVLH